MNVVESTYRIALIPGDGIGREVVPATRQVLEALGAPFEFIELDAGWETFERTGAALPDVTLAALRTCHGAIFGAVSSPSRRVEGYSSPIIGMRRALDLYANLRPIVSAPIAPSRPCVDMLIVRENTEGLYVKQERLSEDGETAIADRVITRRASTRIARMAFEQARARAQLRAQPNSPVRPSSRRRLAPRPPLVTIVHKANVLSVTDGLFREAALAVAAGYPDIAVEEQLVDSMIYRLIREPARYDVVVAPNLYGDIISDGAAALVGGLGLASSANMGDDFVLVEPVHGSAPDIAGQGVANPLATILAAAQLLDALGEESAANRVRRAVDSVLESGPHTPDLGGGARTVEVTGAVVDWLIFSFPRSAWERLPERSAFYSTQSVHPLVPRGTRGNEGVDQTVRLQAAPTTSEKALWPSAHTLRLSASLLFNNRSSRIQIVRRKQMSLQTGSGMAECPECFGEIELTDVMQHEIVQCPDCGADLEVLNIEPLTLELAPEEEEDWGE